MVDTAQIILLVVVVVLTILLVVLGIQVFYILKDFRHTLTKANRVLDDTRVITESVSGPISNLARLSNGIKTGATIAKVLKGKKIVQRLLEEDQHGK